MKIYPSSEEAYIKVHPTEKKKIEEPAIRMANILTQIRVLTKKNFILRKRNIVGAIIEIALPVILTALMVWIYDLSEVQTIPDVIPSQYNADYLSFSYFSTSGGMGEPSCQAPPYGTYMDATIFWRCAIDELQCDVATCDRLYLAIVNTDESNSNDVTIAVNNLQSYIIEQSNNSVFVKTFTSESDYNNYIGQTGYSTSPEIDNIGAAVLLKSAHPSWEYTLQLNHTVNLGFNYQIPPTDMYTNNLLKTPYDFDDIEGRADKRYGELYYESGLLSLQNVVDNFIIQQTAEKRSGNNPQSLRLDDDKNITLLANIVDFPSPGYETESFWASVAPYYGVFMIMALLYSVSIIIRSLVMEKETKLKEGMKMMSLTDFALFFSWSIHFISNFAIISILLALVGSKSLYKYSSLFLIWLYYFLFFAATMSFCFTMSTFFSRSKSAATLGVLPYFAGYFINLAINAQSSKVEKLLVCLHPSAAFTVTMESFIEYEDSQIGINWNTWQTSETGNFTFADGLIMMFLDIWIYAFLTWYFERCFPNEFGLQLPWYFPITPSYWKKSFPNLFTNEDDVLNEFTKTKRNQVESGKDIEDVPNGLKQQIDDGNCITIRSLSKHFQTATGVKKAVNELDLTMYSGQITALLGHNGAGKTTTISMLTGLIPASSGVALILDKNITTDMNTIRQNIGVCPQHDVLFPELTVTEHLYLFAELKGLHNKTILREKVTKMISEVGLVEKRNVQAKFLSGGQKRKLSVGIAFIGDSKVIFLDEPTSGMDPYSRRFTWNVIRKYREDRIIVLTTHFMDEADLLADRIAIMADGQLRCCGSSLFLKQHFGVGYNLTIEKVPNAPSEPIQSLVKSFVKEACVLSDVGSELAIQLPLSTSSQFENLFKTFDNQRKELSIDTYGISVTTLEEVFIKVAEGKEFDKQEIQRKSSLRRESQDSINLSDTTSSIHKHSSSAIQPFEIDNNKDQTILGIEGLSYDEGDQDDLEKLGSNSNTFQIDYSNNIYFFGRHVYALFWKRLMYLKSDTKTWLYQFLLPALFCFLGILLLKAGTNQILTLQFPPLDLQDFSHYNPGVTVDKNPVYYTTTGLWNDFVVGNVTGQTKLMTGINDADTLPIVGVYEDSILNMSTTLLETRNDWQASRYGAYSFNQLNLSAGEIYVNIHYNYTGVHATAIYARLINSAIAAAYDEDVSITAYIEQMPITKYMVTTSQSFDAFPVIMMITMGFSFLPAAFIVFVVREKETKAKHIQSVSGVSYFAYWTSTWLFDILCYQIPCWFCILIIYLYDVKVLVDVDSFGYTIILFLLYGGAVSAFTYVTSFLFQRHSKAQEVTIILNFVFGVIVLIVDIILKFITESTRKVEEVLIFFFRLVPAFAFSNALTNLAYLEFYGQIYGRELKRNELFVTGWSMIYLGSWCAIGILLCVILEYTSRTTFVANLIGFFSSTKIPEVTSDDKDVDVLEEETRVLSGDRSDSICLQNIKKKYPGGKIAVRDISLGIPNGECFGLLGINGAGKSTTMGILTGEFLATSGSAFLGGYNIRENPDIVRRLVGYCPQFDALFDLLTGREHLKLYARIKGVPESSIAALVDAKISEMDLTQYADRSANSYSGGNKRKLSVAMAMIGNPQIVFLDEPSTGMDPVARRFMWKIISDISTKKGECSIVLTTHSMEECEALCTRIGIMVDGRLRCLGSAQHLKSRYGNGYQLEVNMKNTSVEQIEMTLKEMKSSGILKDIDEREKVTLQDITNILAKLNSSHYLSLISSSNTTGGSEVYYSLENNQMIDLAEFVYFYLTQNKINKFKSFVFDRIKGSTLKEEQTKKLRFEIPAEEQNYRLSTLFGILESNQHAYEIEDYALSQISLEQIFNQFAAQSDLETLQTK